MTMEACEEVDHLLEAKICKNLFLCNRQKTDFYLLLMPGEKPFKNEIPVQTDRNSQTFFCRWRADGGISQHYTGVH